MRQARFGFVSVSVSVFVWFRLFQCLVHDTGFYPDRLRTATCTRKKCWTALFETRLVLSCILLPCLVLSGNSGSGRSGGTLVLQHWRSRTATPTKHTVRPEKSPPSSFCAPIFQKNECMCAIILPRQARDKQKDPPKKEAASRSAGMIWTLFYTALYP